MTTSGALSAAVRKALVFQLGSQQFAIDMASVDRITPVAEVHRPPGLPDLLWGFLNLAGDPIVVLCPHALLHLSPPIVSRWTPFLILKTGSGFMALIVDRVVTIATYAPEQVLPLPSSSSLGACISGMWRPEHQSILMLSPDRLLLEEEASCAETLRELEQDRLAKW